MTTFFCAPFTVAETCNLQREVQGRVFYILCGDGGIVANAGPDQVVPEGTLVQLDGSRSTPLFGPDVRYDWTQLAEKLERTWEKCVNSEATALVPR